MPIASAEAAAELPRDVLANRITERIREEIVIGVYAPGCKLRELDFAKRFAVSHNVIREAFHVLQGEGLVVNIPHRGRYILKATPAEARDMLVLRTTLESLAAYWAAGRLTPDSAARIGEQAARIRVSDPKSYVEWVRLELAFHRAVWEAAGLSALEQQLNRTVVPFFSVHFAGCLDSDVDVESSWARAMQEEKEGAHTHQGLCDAILSRDPNIARECMILHLMHIPSVEELRRCVFGF